MNSNEKKLKSVLIVDDDDTLREAIVFDFKRRGYQVFSAPNGVEAFEIVKREKIDAVITDIRMPKGDGVELLDNIKAFNLRIPVVIFITGFADLSLEDAYEKGACVVMSKPFDRKALIEAVQRAMQDNSEKFSKSLDTTSADLNVELRFQDGSEAIQAKAISIAQGGMFLAAQGRQAKVSQTVSFKIENPTANLPLLQGQGIIRWVRASSIDKVEDGFGVEFILLSDGCRKAVIEFLESLQTKAFIPRTP